jgi:ribonuclease P protein component
MLKKDYRLRKKKDFDSVFSNKGSFVSQDFLSMKTVPNELPLSRFGFIVSNKVSKSAVRRNRIKRLLREAIRLHQAQVPPGFDAAILVRADVSAQKLEAVDKAVDSLLKKAGLVKR